MFNRYRKMSRFVFIMLLTFLFQITGIQAQSSSFWSSNWFVGVSPGIVSYFGDLSQYDYNPVNKIIYESGPAISLNVGKKLTNYLEVGILAILGKVSGSRDDWDIEFLNRFNEYGIYTEVSLANIIKPRRRSRIDYGITANYSLMNWRSVSYRISDQGIILAHGLDTDGNKSGEGQTTNYFGAGYYVGFALNSHFTIRLSQTMQILNTDHFDSWEGVSNSDLNDRILRSGIGLIFNINSGRSSGSSFEDCPTF